MGVFGGPGIKERKVNPKKRKWMIYNMLMIVTGKKRKCLLNACSKGKYDFSEREEVKRFLDNFYLNKKK